MAKAVRVSLANKCQLLFGAAVVLILAAALTVVWLRMNTLVREGQEETARKLANAWLDSRIDEPVDTWRAEEETPHISVDPGLTMKLVRENEFDIEAAGDEFLAGAIEKFQTRDDLGELFVEVDEPAAEANASRAGDDKGSQPPGADTGGTLYRYARAIRKSDLQRIASYVTFSADIDTTALADPLEMVLLINLRPDIADQQRIERQVRRNLIATIAAGLLAGLLAIGAFWYITMRLILKPVRVLRDTAAKIAEGDIHIRSDINTGDEYEQLSDAFNAMMERLRAQQEELRRSNKSLDLKLGELAESNVALYEANKIKGEFLANVSHELRTPLNSIIGFAEVLTEFMPSQGGDRSEKVARYIDNIIISSRRLLNLINDLLDLAKIEAGRMEVHVEPIGVRDTCEALLTLIRPQAQKAGVTLDMNVQRNLPIVHTDPGKVHQILFNFLSNAVKFTPEGGKVTVTAALTDTVIGSLRPGEKRLRISVIDTGPGIPFDEQDRIFEKFTQLDTSHTRAHGGTGLGLTISRDLARLLQGEIELESEPGKGATFSLLLPLAMQSRTAPLMPDLAGPAPR